MKSSNDLTNLPVTEQLGKFEKFITKYIITDHNHDHNYGKKVGKSEFLFSLLQSIYNFDLACDPAHLHKLLTSEGWIIRESFDKILCEIAENDHIDKNRRYELLILDLALKFFMLEYSGENKRLFSFRNYDNFTNYLFYFATISSYLASSLTSLKDRNIISQKKCEELAVIFMDNAAEFNNYSVKSAQNSLKNFLPKSYMIEHQQQAHHPNDNPKKSFKERAKDFFSNLYIKYAIGILATISTTLTKYFVKPKISTNLFNKSKESFSKSKTSTNSASQILNRTR